ncbi:UDP-N-acetylmuramoyl-tripeptide--D-alanyl-D-alanine ligase [Pedobacter xixiisoli]|uniref:UDP-N-acetylmuramoyl-tripeptide--D-alanyl-D-alanine ligase n=1 Tax=Pedobacter xixiisoli TaxID=1476464 RepID=A0A286ADR5_9SPHI|nr:UDP-N-acetylmuramoyl-tripeptide--D-alanyl-D-alanine ligase [Pedobacter xixiisoli]SOD20041.1 UDP-N-acetylmuramoyl-tripeptide--D-alanyl-D-alanine ligase [Pedobacter xixiisoli]
MVNIEQLYQHYLKHPVICTDTRSITEGCLFFALKGDHFDANQFAEKAVEAGAAFAIIDNPDFAKGDQLILVDDVLSTLQELAKHHRKQLSIPVIGLTGSNGKTTTKELIRAVLAEHFQVFATKGNLNNHIGVPLSILSITNKVEIAVIEMGANHQKEIELLCSIAQPTHGLISNVGMAHLEGFGGFEGVKKGKAELYAYLSESNGFAFVNAANKDLIEMVSKAGVKNIIRYNIAEESTVQGVLKHSDPLIEFEWSFEGESHEAKANLTGTYNFENILAAISIGSFFKLSAEEINKGLADYFPTNNRSQLTKTEKNTVICDFYNANPSSMAAAITNLNSLTSTNKIAILGDMFELGDESAEQHLRIIELALKNEIDTLIFVGHHFDNAKGDANAHFFTTPTEASTFIQTQNWKDSLILLKGSRGMALEQLLPML